MNTTPSTFTDAATPEDLREILIGRITDGVSVRADWQRLEDVARSDPSVWRDLAYAQHDHSALCAAVAGAHSTSRAGDSAIGASLPFNGTDQMSLRLTQRSRTIAAWAGWAAAAAVGLAWLGMPGTGFTRSPSPLNNSATPETAGLGGVLDTGIAKSAADALQAYLNKGQESGEVIGQVPGKLMINARPLPDGQGYEVLYLRQFLEKTVVPGLYRAATDDSGDLVPTSMPVIQNAGSSATY